MAPACAAWGQAWGLEGWHRRRCARAPPRCLGARHAQLRTPSAITSVTCSKSRSNPRRVCAGSMPYAQQHYPFENKEKFEQGFPADFVAEGLDQASAMWLPVSCLPPCARWGEGRAAACCPHAAASVRLDVLLQASGPWLGTPCRSAPPPPPLSSASCATPALARLPCQPSTWAAVMPPPLPPVQTRGWFYTLMVLSTALFDKPAFKVPADMPARGGVTRAGGRGHAARGMWGKMGTCRARRGPASARCPA